MHSGHYNFSKYLMHSGHYNCKYLMFSGDYTAFDALWPS